MKKVILSLMIILSGFYLNAQDYVGGDVVEQVGDVEELIHVNWQETFEKAVDKANLENKPILIYFTGSDWCGPCKRLDENLFHTEKFAAFSDENMVLYTADYPRNTDLVSEENKQTNEQLSRRYGQTSFPTMIVVNAQGNVLGRKNGAYMADYYLPFFENIVRSYR